jgi:hypothetical protein
VRDATGTPVNKDGVPVADKDVAVVEVAVVDRLRDAMVGQPLTQLGHVRRQVEQSPVLSACQPDGLVDPQDVHVDQERLVQSRQNRQAPIRHAERQEFGDPLRELDLQLGVERQDW